MDITNIVYISVTVLSTIFVVFFYFRNPQVQLDKQQALDKESAVNDVKILVQQVQWEKESNERRFNEVQTFLKDSMTLAQNHTHSISVQVETLTSLVNSLNLDFRSKFTELSTIINERIPKKIQINKD
jgi:cytoskeletal protein RodZ